MGERAERRAKNSEEMSGSNAYDSDSSDGYDDRINRTLYVQNLSDRVTKKLLYELFLQAGPVDFITEVRKNNAAYIEFEDKESVPYAITLFDGLKLYDQALRMKPALGSVWLMEQNPFMCALQLGRQQQQVNLNSEWQSDSSRFSGYSTYRYTQSSSIHSTNTNDDYFYPQSRGADRHRPYNSQDQNHSEWSHSSYQSRSGSYYNGRRSYRY